MDPLTCPAPAKLNLFLHVVGRRSDGYHDLQTVFRFLDLSDSLTVSVRGDGALNRVNAVPGVEAAADLVLRAAKRLQACSGTTLGADIVLTKRIPIGGGLGGGSSDAATTLIALNRLWNLNLPRTRLQQIALELGADVPVFVFGRSAFAEGIGEALSAVALPPAWYTVLVPPVSVPTARIFAHPELTRNSDPITIRGFSAGAGRNDLEAVACGLFPEVGQHLMWLRQFAPAAMTGSGACVFAAFDSEQRAREVLQSLPPAMKGFVARGVDRHPLCDWLDE